MEIPRVTELFLKKGYGNTVLLFLKYCIADNFISVYGNCFVDENLIFAYELLYRQ